MGGKNPGHPKNAQRAKASGGGGGGGDLESGTGQMACSKEYEQAQLDRLLNPTERPTWDEFKEQQRKKMELEGADARREEQDCFSPRNVFLLPPPSGLLFITVDSRPAVAPDFAAEDRRPEEALPEGASCRPWKSETGIDPDADAETWPRSTPDRLLPRPLGTSSVAPGSRYASPVVPGSR